MRIPRLLTFKDYIIIGMLVTLAVMLVFTVGSKRYTPGVITHTVVDTLVVEKLVTQIVKEAKRGPTLIERISQREVQPDRVEISLTPDAGLDSLALGGWGVCVAEKRGRSLIVSSLRGDCTEEGGEAQRTTYTLPNKDSDYVLRSGPTAARLRVGRRLSLIRLDLKASVFGGVNTSGGEPTVGLALEGPISIGTDRLRASPTVIAGYGGDGVRIGGTLELQLGG